jgi:caffeoyl-CoA O-methyltransferase/tricin synthase
VLDLGQEAGRREREERGKRGMAAGGDTMAQVHTGIDSSNKTLLKSEALYKVTT